MYMYHPKYFVSFYINTYLISGRNLLLEKKTASETFNGKRNSALYTHLNPIGCCPHCSKHLLELIEVLREGDGLHLEAVCVNIAH